MMLYEKLFEKKTGLIGGIQELSFTKKCLLCLLISERHVYLVGLFDLLHKFEFRKRFEEKLEIGYRSVMANSFSIGEIKAAISDIESMIPDTEEFGSIEGSYCQNAFIGLLYTFIFIEKGAMEEFKLVYEKFLESTDLLNYEKNQNYDESLILSKEIEVLESILYIIRNFGDDISVANIRQECQQFQLKP